MNKIILAIVLFNSNFVFAVESKLKAVSNNCFQLLSSQPQLSNRRYIYYSGKIKKTDSIISDEIWTAYSTWATGRTITPNTENRSLRSFYSRHGLNIYGDIAARAVTESDIVLWSFAVNKMREHGYFQIFSITGDLLETSPILVGEYGELSDVNPLLKEFIDLVGSKYSNQKIILSFTHTHPHDVASAVSREFSDEDLMSGQMIIIEAKKYGLNLNRFEMYLLHGDDPNGGRYFYRESPTRFAKVGYGIDF
jgi:hypothetical protein